MSDYEDGYRDAQRRGVRFVLIYLYIAAGLFTFAYHYETFNDLKEDARQEGAFFAGLGWPLYWPGVGALKAIRSLRSEAPAKKVEVPNTTAGKCIHMYTGEVIDCNVNVK